MRRVARRDAAVLAFATAMAFVGSLAAPAAGGQAPSAPGVSCATQSNAVQACIGDSGRFHAHLIDAS
jgi:hypothetical protein